MPLSTDEKMLKLSRDVIEAFDKANGGVHAGFRPAHAKGVLLTGTFTPAAGAASLTRASHIQRASTPVTRALRTPAALHVAMARRPGLRTQLECQPLIVTGGDDRDLRDDSLGRCCCAILSVMRTQATRRAAFAPLLNPREVVKPARRLKKMLRRQWKEPMPEEIHDLRT